MMTAACFLKGVLLLCRHLVYIKLKCTCVFAVMHCWSRSDAIDIKSLGLDGIVNHIRYSRKQC